MIDLLFIINLVFLLIGHELDAIRQAEWRFFFSWTPLSDEAAYRLFVALHIPLVVLILWNMHSFWFQVFFDLFLIVHAGLHFGLRNHKHVNFDNWFSWLWIYGGALLGMLHLSLLLPR